MSPVYGYSPGKHVPDICSLLIKCSDNKAFSEYVLTLFQDSTSMGMDNILLLHLSVVSDYDWHHILLTGPNSKFTGIP